MLGIGSLISREYKNHQRWDFLMFTTLTLLSLLQGQTTVFYLIYFFWWNELIRLFVDRYFLYKNPNIVLGNGLQIFMFIPIFMMVVYWVFIVVFFGFLSGLENPKITQINFRVIFFQNWFFNANLLFVLVERIFLHFKKQPLQVSLGAFTPNMIVLHISIILGANILFFVVYRYPKTFTPDNLWASVLVALPFLLIKMLMVELTNRTKTTLN